MKTIPQRLDLIAEDCFIGMLNKACELGPGSYATFAKNGHAISAKNTEGNRRQVGIDFPAPKSFLPLFALLYLI